VKFLAVSQNVGDPSPYFEAEGARTQVLQQTGVFERVLLKADWSGAVILVEAADVDEARAAVDSLPLVVNAVTSFELTPLVEPSAPPA
jgi:hypothetical protein